MDLFVLIKIRCALTSLKIFGLGFARFLFVQISFDEICDEINDLGFEATVVSCSELPILPDGAKSPGESQTHSASTRSPGSPRPSDTPNLLSSPMDPPSIMGRTINSKDGSQRIPNIEHDVESDELMTGLGPLSINFESDIIEQHELYPNERSGLTNRSGVAPNPPLLQNLAAQQNVQSTHILCLKIGSRLNDDHKSGILTPNGGPSSRDINATINAIRQVGEI